MNEENKTDYEPIDAVSDDIEVIHYKSNNFVSTHATGSIVAGPAHGDLFYLTFFSDIMDVVKETGRLKESTPDKDGITTVYYGLGIQDKDVMNYREDRARIILTRESATVLMQTLHAQLSIREQPVSSQSKESNETK
ncbi:hypothetical protein W03_09720 [Nitrosomonas sp. PY1]|uniref:hypothetical protein n=1 Tax=Nitrosomonas sp. PY1 TaxID=1803906 RepID=UPI001FC8BF08|nr:hypothetical protein [Nitrosomonas sp. PY1]GKS68968.1 hypothetical protein W03_09720 [Nitrosomonas sp. PY1]